MKRFLSLLLVLVLILALAVGCTKPADNDDKTPDTEDDNGGEDNGAEEPAVGKVAKVGLGHVASIDSSKDAEDDKGALAQADVTVAAVGFDADGKVVSVTIDTTQAKVQYDEDGKITNMDEEIKSKHELKEEYNMIVASPIKKEWYEQMNAFQDWMVGKTVDEITGLKLTDDAKPEDEDLTSSVTMVVADYLAVVKEAWENAVDVENGETVGLGFITNRDGSKDAEDDENALAKMESTMTATAFDADGKVVGTIIDTVQIEVKIDEDGKIENKDAEFKTKHELKEDYGMKGTSESIGIGKEWYEQMNAFQDWMVGKSVDEITGMKLVEKDDAHPAIPDEADLTSSVTMTVQDYLKVVDLASKAAK